MEPYRVTAYDLQTGVRVSSLRAGSVSWSHSWNEVGSMSVDLTAGPGMRLDETIIEQRTAIALWRGSRIVHAGPVTVAPEWDPSTSTLRVSCGGGWSLFDWLPAMDSRLKSQSFDGTVTVDEDDPDPGLNIGFAGSAGDIVKGWIGLAQQWASGRLPVNVPIGYTATRSDLTTSAAAWDFKTVGDMLETTVGLASGGQLRFDPAVGVDGRLRWQARWSETGLVDHEWKWNPLLPGMRVVFKGVAAGSGPAVTDSWATGGKNNDTLMITRRSDKDALAAGWPLVFKGDTSAGSANSLAALHAAARNNLNASRRDRTWRLSVGTEFDVRVGDHVDLRVNDQYLHETRPDGTRTATLIPLLVTDVSGSTGSEWLDVQCRQRSASVDGIRPGAGDPMTVAYRRIRALSQATRMANAAGGSQVYATTAKVRALVNGRK